MPITVSVVGAPPGLLDGLALGAMAASAAPAYDCGTIRQAVVDQYIVGYRYVLAC